MNMYVHVVVFTLKRDTGPTASPEPSMRFYIIFV